MWEADLAESQEGGKKVKVKGEDGLPYAHGSPARI